MRPAVVFSIRRSAVSAAEELLVRALLSDEWSRFTAKKLGGEDATRLLSDTRAIALAESLRELLLGHIAPSQAVGQLRDESLIDYADRFLMGEFDEPLSGEVIEGCIETLVRQDRQQTRREFLQNSAPAPGGMSDEQLRLWAESAQSTKRGEGGK